MNSLGLRGNYSVMINYEHNGENHIEFIDFLCNLDSAQSDSLKSQSSRKQTVPICRQFEATIPKHSCELNVSNAHSEDDITELKFVISKPSSVSATTRKF